MHTTNGLGINCLLQVPTQKQIYFHTKEKPTLKAAVCAAARTDGALVDADGGRLHAGQEAAAARARARAKAGQVLRVERGRRQTLGHGAEQLRAGRVTCWVTCWVMCTNRVGLGLRLGYNMKP